MLLGLVDGGVFCLLFLLVVFSREAGGGRVIFLVVIYVIAAVRKLHDRCAHGVTLSPRVFDIDKWCDFQ